MTGVQTCALPIYATARIQEQMLSGWELVKRRTAASGAVWRSADGPFYKRTGDESVRGEAAFQIDLAKRGYPVPSVTECGLKDGIYHFVEPSAGVSLHDQALAALIHPDTSGAGWSAPWCRSRRDSLKPSPATC